MTDIIEMPMEVWDAAVSPALQEQALCSLEQGGVLFFPRLDFSLSQEELGVMTSSVNSGAKNVSFDPAKMQLRGIHAADHGQQILQGMMSRYAMLTNTLLTHLLPTYSEGLQQARTSFRPTEIIGRKTSWRKDDTRLHVDSFPATPTRGNRILRVFTNVNQDGKSRDWRLGESFEATAKHFLPDLARPLPGVAPILDFLGITKTRRSDYDHFMLQLHDCMKADFAYQASVTQSLYKFPAGSSWIAYTDQVSHAAISGQYMFEQTYYLPVASMQKPIHAPVSVLEQLLGRVLVGHNAFL